MAWLIVPEYPKELTPATRNLFAPDDNGSDLMGNRTANSFESILFLIRGFKVSRAGLGGAHLSPSTKAALIRPAIPAAHSKCPMFALVAPTFKGLVWF